LGQYAYVAKEVDMRLNKIKNGNYYIYFKKEDGKKTRISTKTKYKREALKFLVQFEKELENRRPSNTITLGELRKKYLMAIDTTHSKGSYRHAKMCLKNLIEFVGEDVNLDEITKEQVEKFIFGIYKRSKHSSSLHLRHLKAIFNKAIDWGYLDKNPFRGIKLRIPEQSPSFLSKEELQLIVEKENNPMLVSLYRFAFYTGLRLSEITNVEHNDCDLNRKIINVKNKDGFTTKSKKERIVVMNKVVYDMLINMEKNLSYVFNKEGEKFNPTYVSKSFKKCVRLTQLNNSIHFHTLRHSFASCLIQKGATLYVVKQLLGHSNFSTTQKYAHLRDEDLHNAIKVLD